jgi:hypothetical protein
MLETLNHSNTATVTEAMFTGTGLTGLPAAPSAPTITATAGHKRNHVNITNFGGGDGVSIYRSTIAGTFDYNAPLATEVRYPTFEDKNLTNGTTYYYVARSTKGGLSESVSSSQVSAAPQAGAIPAMSDKAAFIVGAPSVKPIGDANPLASPPTEYNYDEFQEFAVLRAAHILPKREPSAAISGTVSFTNGDKTITGSGTNFLADYRVDGNISVGGSYYQIRWIESNTVMHLWYPYNGATASGISHRPTGDYVNNSDSGRLEAYTNYYDTNMSAYALYFRTGNPYVLQLANEGAVMWRNHIEYESVTRHGGLEYEPNPRSASLYGLAMYALMNNDNAAMWETVRKYAETEKDWLLFPINGNYFGADYRERAYELQFAAILGKCHPSSTERATWTTRAIDWYLNYFKRQMDKYPDGQFRKEMFYFPQDGYYAYHYHQPFIDAIAGESFVMVHKLAVASGNSNQGIIKASYLKWVDATIDDFDDRMTDGGYRVGGLPYSLTSLIASTNSTTEAQAIANQHGYNVPMDVTGQVFGTAPSAGGEPIPKFTDPRTGATERFRNAIYLTNYGYPYYLTGEIHYARQQSRRKNLRRQRCGSRHARDNRRDE